MLQVKVLAAFSKVVGMGETHIGIVFTGTQTEERLLRDYLYSPKRVSRVVANVCPLSAFCAAVPAQRASGAACRY